MIKAIIFSKDRPAQLDLFLQSYYKNGNGLFEYVYVLYHASTPEFAKGYAKLETDSPYWIRFRRETKFDVHTLELMRQHEEGFVYTCFFTDDNIIYKPIPHDAGWFHNFFENRKTLACFSFRLGSNTKIQCQYEKSLTTFPSDYVLEEGCLIWNWGNLPIHTNFGYPLSVDGHIFRTKTILDVANKTVNENKIVNPNALEGIWHRYVDMIEPQMACFPHSVVINSPNNRVQEVCKNKAGVIFGESAKEMNEKFLSGQRIDLESIDFSNIVGCHQELEMKWS